MNITLGRIAAAGLGAAFIIGGLAVGGGAFLGGYVLGQGSEPPPEAVATERVYTAADLETAMAACGIDGAQVIDGVVEIDSAKHRAPNVECFVVEIDAPTLAVEELESITNNPLKGGEYDWANVHLSWVHAREESSDAKWRDVTVKLR